MSNLKMSDARVEDLRAAIAPFDTAEARAAYRAGLFPRAHLVKDLDKRYRWDLLRAALPARDVCELYSEGLTDIHIDSALRTIVPAL